MKRILEKIHKEVEVLSERNKKLADEYNRLEDWKANLARKEDLIASSDEKSKEMEELDQEKEKLAKADEKYNKEYNALKRRIDETRKEIIKKLSYKKRIVKKYMGMNLKNINISTLKKEKEKLEYALELSKVSEEEFEKLDSEKQKEVLQARDKTTDNKKRASEIEDIINYVRTVSIRNPQDVLDDIAYVIGEVSKKFKINKIGELSSLKLNSKSAKRKAKEDEQQNGDIGEKPNETGEEKGQIIEDKPSEENAEQELAEVRQRLMNKMKKNQYIIWELMEARDEYYNSDLVKYDAYSRRIEELQEENKEIYENLFIKKVDVKQQNDGMGEKPNETGEEKGQIIEDQPSEENVEQELAEVRQRLMNRMMDNRIGILKLKKAMDKYKNDPEKYDVCFRKLKEVQDQNKKIYEALFLNKVDAKQQNEQVRVQTQQHYEDEKVTIKIIVPEGEKEEIRNVINEAIARYYSKKNSNRQQGDIDYMSDSSSRNRSNAFKDSLKYTRLIDEEDIEDYHYENYEKAVEESQQRHKEMMELIEDQR